jgi:hypothetical protein
MIPGTINNEKYPIALDESGNLQWQTIQVAEERDEVWEDWSLGLGETKRETGQGYFFSAGFDASTRGALRLSPFHHNLNNATDHTTGYAYMMEEVGSTPETISYDSDNAATASDTDTSVTISDFVVGSGGGRILIVGISSDGTITAHQGNAVVKFDGQWLNRLAVRDGGAVAVSLWYLVNPPIKTGDITFTINTAISSANMVIGAATYIGVDGNNPFGSMVNATGTSTTVSVTVTTASGELVVDAASIDATTATAGADQTQRWNAIETARLLGSQQAGADDGVMTWDLGASKEWVTIAVPLKQAVSTSGQQIIFWADDDKITKYTYDPDSGITDVTTTTVASGVAGRPAKMNGKWYVPFGSGANARRLDDSDTPTWADAGWEADHLATFQKGVQPTLARVNSTTQNTVELNDDTSGNVGDTWTNESEEVGDVSTKITDLMEAQGELLVAKEDGLYSFGSEAESFPVIPFLGRGNIDPDNGKGSFAFGDEIIYMSKGNLWRYRIGRGALPIGLNTIRFWRKLDGIIDTPKSGRPVFGVHVEEYWYYLQNNGEFSHLIQARKRREGDPAGHELIQHSVLTIPISKGLGVDRSNHLWTKGASTAENDRDIRVIDLAEDGSLDIQNRKGQASFAHEIYFDERNPGRPQDKVQIRRYTVELEGDWDATTSLQLKLWLDNATSAVDVGSAITAAGMTTRNPTVGTSDTANRFRPQLTLTTNSSYTPRNSDPQILRVIIGIRFPEIIRIVVNAEPEALKAAGMSLFEVEQNLRRLQNQGVVTFREPGEYDDPTGGTDLVTDRTFQGEIEAVTNTLYKTSEGYAKGIELRVKRWVTV